MKTNQIDTYMSDDTTDHIPIHKTHQLPWIKSVAEEEGEFLIYQILCTFSSIAFFPNKIDEVSRHVTQTMTISHDKIDKY